MTNTLTNFVLVGEVDVLVVHTRREGYGAVNLSLGLLLQAAADLERQKSQPIQGD